MDVTYFRPVPVDTPQFWLTPPPCEDREEQDED